VTVATPDKVPYYGSRERLRGYYEALREAGIDWADVTTISTNVNSKGSIAVTPVQLNRGYALSAMPDAPIVPPELPRRSGTVPIRRSVATVLHRLADLVEPRAAAVGHAVLQ
jgi:hypothetical protein